MVELWVVLVQLGVVAMSMHQVLHGACCDHLPILKQHLVVHVPLAVVAAAVLHTAAAAAAAAGHRGHLVVARGGCVHQHCWGGVAKLWHHAGGPLKGELLRGGGTCGAGGPCWR